MASRPALRRGLILIALATGAIAAVPTGWSLSQWVILDNLPLATGAARHWPVLPGGLIMVGVAVLIARLSPRALWFALPVMVFALLVLGAWRGVAAGVDAYRDGPLNAAL